MHPGVQTESIWHKRLNFPDCLKNGHFPRVRIHVIASWIWLVHNLIHENPGQANVEMVISMASDDMYIVGRDVFG